MPGPVPPRNSGNSRQAVLVGASGFLGKAIQGYIRNGSSSFSSLIVPDHRRLVVDLLGSRSADAFPIFNPGTEQDWIVTTGLVDPRSDPADLYRINVEFPFRLYEQLATYTGPGQRRLVTFGSVLENRADIAESNPYIGSKAQLRDIWTRASASSSVDWIHFQLHTLYGGADRPRPFMFTGQMFSALKSRSIFKMSAGVQLREYHHVDDIAESVVALLQGTSGRSERVELSSGRPVQLCELARSVFIQFGAEHLLLIGAKPAARAEVFESRYRRSPELISEREPCEGVARWFEALGLCKLQVP